VRTVGIIIWWIRAFGRVRLCVGLLVRIVVGSLRAGCVGFAVVRRDWTVTAGGIVGLAAVVGCGCWTSIAVWFALRRIMSQSEYTELLTQSSHFLKLKETLF
jgi:hypothetical protein